MDIKQILVGLFATACLAQTALAVPADPRPRKVRQADGSYITVVTRGDEFGHVTMTTDGYPLCLNEATGNYEYAAMSAGTLAPSGIIATDVQSRSAKATEYLHRIDLASMLSTLDTKRLAKVNRMRTGARRAPASSGPRRAMLINDYPTTGSPNALIILVQFSDMTFDCEDGDPKGYYENMFNQSGFKYKNGANGSVSDFFKSSSNGLFTPHFDIVGPVTLPKSYAYYGANTTDASGATGDRMDRLQEFVKEACEAAAPEVDFSKYDNNGDGRVDNVYLYYAGFGEADSEYKNSIWPHSFYYSNFGAGSLTFNGVTVDNYTCSQERNGNHPELPVGIGTFCHEFSHVLGLPDHYSTVYNDAFTPGEYDVMDTGPYNNNQNTPPTHSAYERAELGWLDYVKLDTKTDTISVLPDLKMSNKAYVVPVDGTDGREFFVLENRQQTGWDRYIPGHGMLMWHIDQDRSAWMANTVNNNVSHQRVDIVEADGKATSMSTSGDPFPGKSEVHEWNITAWDKRDIMRLDNIDEVDGNIQILVAGTNFTIGKPEITIGEVADSSFVVSWKAVDKAARYELNIYKVADGTRTAVDKYTDISFTEPGECRVEGLEPDTRYEVEMTAWLSSYSSEPAIAETATQPLAFAKRLPVNLAATEVGSDGFNVTWDEVPTADDYMVDLSRLDFTPDKISRGYDFAQRGSGMPKLWSFDGVWMGLTQYCGKESPSLQLSKTGSYLSVAYPDSKIVSLSFYITSTKNTAGSISIERCVNGVWTKFDEMAFETGFVSGTRHIDLAPADTVRLVYNRTSGSLFIDDVEVGCCDAVRSVVDGYSAKSTSGCHECSFTGLQPDTRYAVVVTAKQGDELSLRSKELIVNTNATTGIRSINVLQDAGNDGVYNLSGCRISGAEAGHGVYVVRRGGKAYKICR